MSHNREKKTQLMTHRRSSEYAGESVEGMHTKTETQIVQECHFNRTHVHSKIENALTQSS